MALVAPLPTVAVRSRSRLWGVPVYWHLLSLDAPTVAVLWAWSFARAAGIRIPLIGIAVLGVGTWIIYVADRILDAGSPAHPALHERHFFHARHRISLLQGSAVAGALLLGLISIMPGRPRREDAIVFTVAMLYFAGVHLPALRVRRWFPREVAVGIVFALATAVPAWSGAASGRAELGCLVLLFAGLCTLNCIAIETWERPAAFPGSTVVSIFALCVAGASIAFLLIPGLGSRGESGVCAASLLSSMLLLTLDQLYRGFVRGPADPEKRARMLLGLRVAADAALLTPIFLLLPWHL